MTSNLDRGLHGNSQGRWTSAKGGLTMEVALRNERGPVPALFILVLVATQRPKLGRFKQADFVTL